MARTVFPYVENHNFYIEHWALSVFWWKMRELGRVQDGEILVAPVTAPSWVTVFAKIKATVTDIGGMMSHAAVVCREYDLPAVTGIGNATPTIRTGQRIRVDGSKGEVVVLG